MKVLERHGPVVVMRCARVMDAGFMARAVEEFDELLRGTERFAVIVETSAVEMFPSANERKQFAAWMNRADVRDAQKRLNVGSSTIVRNAAMRGIMTAFYWIWTPPTPQHAAEDLAAAVRFALERLAAEGLRAPFDADTLLRRIESRSAA